MTKPVIFAFSGCARVGKTTCADRLDAVARECGRSCHRLSFASPLKDGLKVMGVTKEEHYDVYRHLAQYIGTDVLRKYDPNWWLNLMKARIDEIIGGNSRAVIVVDDIRFQNEIDTLKSYTDIATVIHTFVYGGPGRIDLSLPVYTHDSEIFGATLESDYTKNKFIEKYRADVVLNNSFSLDCLNKCMGKVYGNEESITLDNTRKDAIILP